MKALLPLLYALVLLLNAQRACCQETHLGDVMQISTDNSITAYLSCDGYLINQNCATFFRKMPIDDYLRTDGEVLDYSIRGALIGRAKYVKGIKNGTAKGYYENGALRYEGFYSNSRKTGVWKYYYLDGDLARLIKYENGTPRLMNSSNGNGKVTVRGGSGSFEGTLMLDRLSCKEYLVAGVVRNGFMDGRWTIRDKYTQQVLFKETFRNGRFIEGRDYSVDDGKLYITKPRASFEGYNLLENAYYFSDIPCAESPQLSIYQGERNLSMLYKEIIERLTFSDERESINGRALINLKLDSTGIQKVSIHSTFTSSAEAEIKDFLQSREGWNTSFVKKEENRFFILFAENGNIQIPDQRRLESIDESVEPEYEVGETKDGSRVGIWNFYDASNNLELTVDFDKPSINFFRKDTSRFLVDDNGQWLRKSVDRPAMYLGSSKVLKDQIINDIEYPKEALKQRVQGDCLFSFEITPDGFAENLMVIDDLGHGTKKEVENALNGLDNLWVPAVVGGKTVRTLFYVSVSFTFDENRSSSRFVKPYFLELTITP